MHGCPVKLIRGCASRTTVEREIGSGISRRRAHQGSSGMVTSSACAPGVPKTINSSHGAAQSGSRIHRTDAAVAEREITGGPG
jgi:hypothetical protein